MPPSLLASQLIPPISYLINYSAHAAPILLLNAQNCKTTKSIFDKPEVAKQMAKQLNLSGKNLVAKFLGHKNMAKKCIGIKYVATEAV